MEAITADEISLLTRQLEIILEEKDRLTVNESVSIRTVLGLDTPKVMDKIKLPSELEIWRRLHALSDIEVNKAAMGSPSLGLLRLMTSRLRTSSGEVQILCIGCILYLSRDRCCKIEMIKDSLHLVEELVLFFENSSDELRIGALRPILNLALQEQSLDRLFQPHINLIPSALAILRVANDEETIMWTVKLFDHLASKLTRVEHVNMLLHYNVHGTLVEFLRPVLRPAGLDIFRTKGGSDPIYWACRFFLYFCFYSEAAEAVKCLHIEGIFESISTLALESRVGFIGLNAFFVLSYLYGKNEQITNGTGLGLLASRPHLLPKVLECLQCILENRNLPGGGSISLQPMLRAILSLAISDANKHILVESSLLPQILCTLDNFRQDGPAYQVMYFGGTMNDVGGGGKDAESASLALEILSQLSFYFYEDEAFRLKFMSFGVDVAKLLSEILELSSTRAQVSRSAKLLTRSLCARLFPPTSPSSSLQVSSPGLVSSLAISQVHSMTQGHIMVSYSWSAGKNLVTSLCANLRRMGFDIWRDEEGSSLVPAMSGDIYERMAEAIEKSSTVIICVSPAYKESANCRLEASYCLSKKKKLVFVMMTEGYHMHVDGWLGFLLGAQLWYPLYKESNLGSTCQQLVGILSSSESPPNFRPLVASSIASTTSSASPIASDFGLAWETLQSPAKIKDIDGLTACMTDLGISEPEELPFCEELQLRALASYLKPIPSKIFLDRCGLKGSN